MKLKTLLVVVLLLVVAAAGVNYYRGKPLLSNPFAAKTWDEKLRDAFR